MVHPVEFESTTTALKARCSTVELRMHYWKNKCNFFLTHCTLNTSTMTDVFQKSSPARKFFEILIFFDIIDKCPKKKKKSNN